MLFLVSLLLRAASASICSPWGCTCQGFSDYYGTWHSIDWGNAPMSPPEVYRWWQDQPCDTEPDCWFGWAKAQLGLQSLLLPTPLGSNGCCANAPEAADPDREHWCRSTGDPHITQFNHATNHAYINGDYDLYHGVKLRVVLRHVNNGNVAGNNGFHISGSMLGGHSLEYHDVDTVSRQPHRTTPTIYYNNIPVAASGGLTAKQVACKKFTDANQVCSCEWGPKNLKLVMNDRTYFKFEQWEETWGWNNAYLMVDPNDMASTDTGMCTSDMLDNDSSHNARTREDPYPDNRLPCTNDPFAHRTGTDSHGNLQSNYFCLPASQVRRRLDAVKRRRFGDEVRDCASTKRDLFAKAYAICEPCVPLGNVKLETCLLDACMMDGADYAKGEAAGCTTEIIARLPHEQRKDYCPSGSSWSDSMDACLGEFVTKQQSTCGNGALLSTSSKFLQQCDAECKANVNCKAFAFYVFTNECKQYSTCQLTASTDPSRWVYLKAAAGHVLARGGGIDDDMPGSTGPSASYGGGGTSSSSSSLPDDFEDMSDSVKSLQEYLEDAMEDLQDELEDAHDSVKELTDDFEGELRAANQEVRELRNALAQMSNSIGTSGSASQTNADNSRQYQQIQPGNTNSYGQMQPGNANSYGQPGNSNIYGQTGNTNNYGTMTQQVPRYDEPTGSSKNSDSAWKTAGIVSIVLSFLILIGLITAVSVYFCCFKK